MTGLPSLARRVSVIAVAASLSLNSLLAAADEPRPDVIVVVGAEGTPEYGEQFRQWAERWQAAAKRGQATFLAIGLDNAAGTSDRQRLEERLGTIAKAGAPEARQEPRPPAGVAPVWLVLVGHGTFDGKSARFNLRGDDISAAELGALLKPIERPLAVVNCASASGPFLTELSAPGRVVISAAKSGHEYNFARFGDYLSASIADPSADLDKDDQTSLLEAYLLAASRVKEFYASETRLATEHSLLDDNGDKLGTPADWFRGTRAAKAAKDGAAPDGLRAGQLCLVPSPQEEQLPAAVRTRRDELERDLAALREQKARLPEADYLAQLEPLLVELARLYQGAEPM